MMSASKRAWFARHRCIAAWFPVREYEAIKRAADEEGEALCPFVRDLVALGLSVRKMRKLRAASQ
jgi:hypothetical protein